MKHQRWIVWLLAGGLVLGACQGAAGGAGQVPVTLPQSVATEPPTATHEPTPEACQPQAHVDADRYRAWVLFLVDDPQAATSAINSPDSEEQYPLKKGGVDYVIVRADIVSDDTNGDFNLVVPVDAEGAAGFEAALGELKSVIGADPARILRVVAHTPWPPHCSDTVVTQGELEGFYLKEYDPAGRHPHSPGANPWG